MDCCPADCNDCADELALGLECYTECAANCPAHLRAEASRQPGDERDGDGPELD
jgi:hypothetical protein